MLNSPHVIIIKLIVSSSLVFLIKVKENEEAKISAVKVNFALNNGMKDFLENARDTVASFIKHRVDGKARQKGPT